jgi:hypothetical protein
MHKRRWRVEPSGPPPAPLLEAGFAIGGVLQISVRRHRRVRGVGFRRKRGQGWTYRRGGGTTIVCRVPVGQG